MPKPEAAGIEVLGVRALTREINALDKDLAKGIGQENKQIGQDIIARAEPKPLFVGKGAGAIPRAAASRNMVAIRAGGPHRTDPPRSQWGRRHAERAEERPFIVKSAEQQLPNFQDRYLEVLERAARKAGLDGRGVVTRARIF
jgi:hypothetical protein